jgi:hypothetical protein
MPFHLSWVGMLASWGTGASSPLRRAAANRIRQGQAGAPDSVGDAHHVFDLLLIHNQYFIVRDVLAQRVYRAGQQPGQFGVEPL